MSIISFLLSPLIDKRINEFQSDLMEKHFNEVQNIYRQMRGWRHDYHNHIQTMQACLAIGNIDKLEEYLLSLDNDLSHVDTIIKTGNVMVDAILNSKLSLATTRKIEVNAKAVIPQELSVSEVDLCVVLGNLLDNSMEACETIEDESKRFIRVYLGTLKGQLYLSVTNSTGREIKKSGKTYLSTKDKSNHGFGLFRIDKIAQKYNGYINRQNEEGVFATEVMLPL